MVSNSEPLPEGTVIMADSQYAGRGQMGNTWHAEPGLNLTFSVYLKPGFLDVNKQYLLNMAIAIGIRNALTLYVKEGITIKWPNDIYHYNKKLGGVLIENVITGSTYKYAVIGIGINVNQQSFNQYKLGTAESLGKILQQDVNLIELLGKICNQVEAQYLMLKGNHDKLKADYLKGLYAFDRDSVFKDKNGIFKGKITDVTSRGQLIVGVEGSERTYDFKEIQFLSDIS